MNTKLKELANQCWESRQYGPDWFDSEKFAKLIIEECLLFIKPMPGSGDIDDLVLEAATQQIKEHFGIENQHEQNL